MKGIFRVPQSSFNCFAIFKARVSPSTTHEPAINTKGFLFPILISPTLISFIERSLNRFYKILQYLQPFLLTFLRMELCGKKILSPDTGNKRFAIGGESRDPLRLLWNDIIR